MGSNNQEPESVVDFNDWTACYNSGDDVLVVSCSVSTIDDKATITGGGLVVNNSGGQTVGSFYAEFEGSNTVSLAINIPPGSINVGDSIMAVASGEADDQHYFGEKNLSVTNC
jgi:hypothetical protein